MDFVDQGGFVNLGVNSVFSPTSGGWTIMAWAKPLREFISGTNYDIFGNESYENYGLLLRLESNHATTPTAGRVLARTNQSGASSGVATSFYSTINLNQTAHITWTYDGTYTRIYLNGSLIQGPTSQNYPVNSSVATGIGVGSVQRFNGILDDVRFYSRALTAKEIEAIYNATK